MGLYLIAASLLDSGYGYLMAVLGLGLVIFVHELGHFAVAKMCGVKCEKFFIGFDIGGWKISKKWGETEYGIGILPLGGYVKMLGQDDNPYRLREEMERARASQEAAGPPKPIGAGAEGDASATATETSEEQEQKSALFDPRSYLAQSIPERMAIISAGVIMNVIFAFIFSAIAFSMGVNMPPCVVGGVFPGEAGYQANLRPGDEIVMIGQRPTSRFVDLNQEVAFGEEGQGVQMTIRRPGESDVRTIMVTPDKREGSPVPRIGIYAASTTTLRKPQAFIPGTAAAEMSPPLEGGDKIVAVNGTPVKSYPELLAMLVENPGIPLQLTVERSVPEKPTKTIEATVAPQPMKRLGLVMAMGKVTAIQPDSPADKAGLKVGDFITKITEHDGGKEITWDPVLLPEELRRRGGERVDITVTRDGNQTEILQNVPLRKVTWEESPEIEGHPMSAPALGITYRVLNRVQSVIPDSPAAESGKFKQQDEITKIQFLPAPPKEGEESKMREVTLDLSSEKPNWPVAFAKMQTAPADMTIRLWIKGQEQPVELKPAPTEDWYLADRGFLFKPLEVKIQAQSFAQAMSLAGRQTVENLTMVVKFLQRIPSMWKAAGGPLTIFSVASAQAERGMSDLLLFLAMLSANLAVINILPIPILDGGHLVFLTLEGIRGKPVSERVFHAVTVVGFVFILSLMVFVFGLDIERMFNS